MTQRDLRPSFVACVACVQNTHNSPEALYGLGSLLATNNREPAEAEKVYRAGLEQWAKLVKDFPDDARYRIYLGGILHNLAILRLEAFGDTKQARELLEQAIVHQEKALQSHPDNATSRQFLRNHYRDLAVTLLRSNDHFQAAKAAGALPILYPKGWQEYYRAAGFLAQCVSLGETDNTLPEEKRREAAKKYADQAMAFLAAAVRKGFNDADALKKIGFLETIRSRADYQRLLVELKKK